MKKIMMICLMALMVASAQAQCPGNLVTNGDFEAGVIGPATTDYTYVAPPYNNTTIPYSLYDEGDYTVHTNPYDTHASWEVMSDHTPTGPGNMLIVNAYTPSGGETIWQRMVDVIPEAEYTFTYWLANVHPDNPGELQVYINGIAVGTPVSAVGAGDASWLEVSRDWTSPAILTSATIKLVDMTGEQHGSDFAIDDICFVSLCPDPGLEKEITTGPDVDAVGGIDVVVEVGKGAATSYCFTISYSNPGGPDVLILDTVPAEWDVDSVVSDNIDDDVDFFRAGRGNPSKSATKIEWRPASDCSTLTVCVTSRGRGRSGKFSPTSCGMLCLNNGAEAYEVDEFGEPLVDPGTGERLPPIMESDSLCLAAVEDLNGGGIVGDGSGDEDEDGLEDWDEVMIYGTEPCNPDTDGDGLNDGEEVDIGTNPLDSDTDDDGVPDGEDPAPLDPCNPIPC